MNWKTKFIIAWMNKKAAQDLEQQLNSIINNENSPKYQLYKTIKERYFDNSLDLQKNYFKWFILQLPKLDKETFNAKTTEEIINLPEIQDNIYDFVSAFEKIKELENNNLLTKGDYDKIRTFKSITELQSIVLSIISSKHLKVNKEEFESQEEIPKIIYSYDLDNNHYDVYLPLTVKQFLYIGDNNKGTTWCFGGSENHAHSYYLKAKNKDYVYVVYKNDKPFAALHEGTNQYHGTNNAFLHDDEIEEIMSVLIDLKLYSALFNLYERKKISKEELDNSIDMNRIITTPKYAVSYAKRVLKSRWPQDRNGKIAEYNIVKDAYCAFEYAKYFNFKWNENTEIGQIALTSIAKGLAYEYAEQFNFEWKENTLYGKIALNNIVNECWHSCRYAIKFNFQWDENTLLGQKALTSITKNVYNACDYAKYFNFKWDENNKFGKIALNNIVSDADYAYKYAKYFGFQWDENTEIGKIALINIFNNNHYCCVYNWDKRSKIGKEAIFKIINDSKMSCDYARFNIKGMWQQNKIGQIAEINISKKAESACEYAVHCIKGRWPQDKIVVIGGKEYNIGKEAEKKIAKNMRCSFLYSISLIDKNGRGGDRWPYDTGLREYVEMKIASKDYYAYFYAMDCIKGRWPQDTESGRIAEMTIAKSKGYVFMYAANIIKDKWDISTETGKIALQTIMNSNERYAYDGFLLKNGYNMNFDVKYIVKGIFRIMKFIESYGSRWPIEFGNREKVEMIIAKKAESAYRYAKYCIKSRWPQNENIGRIAEQTIKNNRYIWEEYCRLFDISK